MTVEALEVDGLCYHYKSDWTRKIVHALRDISFTVSPGECFGYIGANGAGKTTTIKCLLGLIKPKKGEVRIFGGKSLQGVSYIAERPYFYDNLTVLETMGLFYDLTYTEGSKEFQPQFEALIARLGLETKIKAKLSSLSKGLTQRVALALALLNDPKMLLLDEPFSGLDPIGRILFRDIFLDLKQQGKTIFICSHILNDIEILCDRVAIVFGGVLKGVHKLKELQDETYEVTYRLNHELHKVSLPYEEAMELVRESASKTWELISFNRVSKKLEELFVSSINS